MAEENKKGKRKKDEKKKEKLINPGALIQVFGPTRKMYKEIGKLTCPFRITGVRPTLKGFTFRKARISKTHEIPTLKFMKETFEKFLSKKEKSKKGGKSKKGKKLK